MMTRRIFQLIDLDRTIFDTSKFVKLITDEINKTQPGLGTELDKRFEDAYKNEVTFFLMRYLRQQMGNEDFELLVRTVVEREGGESFLLPGAKERLVLAEQLSDLKPTWGIITYGDVVDQQLKLRIVGLEKAPVLLVNSPDKGSIIASWKNDRGAYDLPEVFGAGEAELLTLEDDKLRAFTEIPSDVVGLWVTQFDDAQQRMEQACIKVVPVRNLIESSKYLSEDFLSN